MLAPAGTLEKLKWAAEFGADAVYFGSGYNLRSFAGNFSLDDVQEGIKYLHERGKKAYITLNLYPFTSEYEDISRQAQIMDEMGADAFIVADIGILNSLRKLGVKARLHISTQANTMSAQSVLAYKELEATRVNLARELSLGQIQEIQKVIAGHEVETEVFVHGAVCFSYSGRCAISDYLTGRRANRGECTHPCRWKYELVEEERPGEYHPVFEDERGLYLFNSKDLALFDFIHPLIEAGVDSFKIEGRMKSVHYIASVVSLYRRIIDKNDLSRDEILDLLGRVKNRGYSQGFMKGGIELDDYKLEDNHSDSAAIFVGNVLGKSEEVDDRSVFRVRNKVHSGDVLEILKPDGSTGEITLTNPLRTAWGGEVDFANNEEKIVLEQGLPEFTILRRIKK